MAWQLLIIYEKNTPNQYYQIIATADPTKGEERSLINPDEIVFIAEQGRTVAIMFDVDEISLEMMDKFPPEYLQKIMTGEVSFYGIKKVDP